MEGTARERFKNFLSNHEFIVMDGPLGTVLQSFGVSFSEKDEFLNITNPDLIYRLYSEYLKAGSDIFYTNTFGFSKKKLGASPYSQEELGEAAIKVARQAVKDSGRDALIIFDIGPLGELMYPNGDLSYDEAYEQFADQVKIAQKYGADLIGIETMSDIYELKAAILAAKENTDLPVICTMTFETDGRSFSGTDVPTYVNFASSLGVDALGINCSNGPKALAKVINGLLEYCRIPIILKPNAGLPDPETGKYSLSPELFREQILHFAKQGVKFVGSCCGSGPAYIKQLKEATATLKYERKIPSYRPAVSMASALTYLDEGCLLVGESINPSAGKKVAQALVEGDYAYLAKLAVEQEEAGAKILDVNVSYPGVNEVTAMRETVLSLISVCHAPLQLDSKNPDALEAGLRVYNARPIVNSLALNQKELTTILPLAQKYGAALILSPIKDQMLPRNKEEYKNNLLELLQHCEAAGMKREDLIADALVYSLQSEAEAVKMTLDNLEVIKDIGLLSCIGVSNLSHGLKARAPLNQEFLSLCLSKDLDLAIANPFDTGITERILAHKALQGDTEAYAALIKLNKEISREGSRVGLQAEANLDLALERAIYAGLAKEAERICALMIEKEDGMIIIESVLLPVLDELGRQYNEGEIFLPQLLQSASSAQAALDLIRKSSNLGESSENDKNTIIMATVEGDIHDIGKNIAKTILENYGYNVLDLGRDVPPALVAEKVVEIDCKLVGLSALMTNTLAAMEESIRLVKEQRPDCKVMVGGAVLTPDYARKIGADYYCPDANSDIKWAREVFAK